MNNQHQTATDMDNAKHYSDIANETLIQLITLTPRDTFLSWGINTPYTAKLYKGMPTLCFGVCGRLFKGNVLIALNEGVDYYEIYLQDAGGTRRIAYDLDFTQLGEVIDTAIERGDDIEEYHHFCEAERQRLFSGELF